MKRVKGAAIVNVSSRNALSSSPRAATYDAAKAALLALTRTLAVELGGDGIRVNAVLPGFIDTPIHGDLLKDRVFVKNYLKLIPLNRIGKPEDIANIIFFLASDGAAFITGPPHQTGGVAEARGVRGRGRTAKVTVPTWTQSRDMERIADEVVHRVEAWDKEVCCGD